MEHLTAERDTVQRRTTKPAAKGGSTPHLQRSLSNRAVGVALQRDTAEDQQSSPVLDVVGQGGGDPLRDEVRHDMEQRFGSNFADVRVHTGGTAASSAAAVGARAYTVGNDIVFNDGVYDPGSIDGIRTLAHELTHVLQQRSGPVDGTPTADGVSVSDPGDRFEREAVDIADRVVSDSPIAAVGSPAAAAHPVRHDAADGRGVVQRDGDEDDPFRAPASGLGSIFGTWAGPWLEPMIDAAQPATRANKFLPTPEGHRLSARGGGLGALGGFLSMYSGISDLVSYGARATDDGPPLQIEDHGQGLGGLLDAYSGATTFAGSLGLLPALGYYAPVSANLAGVGAGGVAAGGMTAGGLLATGGAVAGAATAGWLAGRGFDELGGLAGRLASGDEEGDYRPSTLLAEAMHGSSWDPLRAVGMVDADKPEYTQTIGWRLANAAEWLGL